MRRRWGRPLAFRWKPTLPARGRGFRASRRWTPRAAVPARRTGFVPRKSRTVRTVPGGASTSGWTIRPRKRMKRRHFWILIVLLLIFSTIQSMLFLDKYLRDPLMFLAKVRITQIASEAINQAMMDNIAGNADSSKMIQWKTNEAGKITGFLIDYKEQMSITAETIQVVERTLEEQASLYEKIPLGHALNSPFLSSIGPSVAVRFHPASAVQAEVRTKQTSAGINMLQVEVYVHITTQIAVVIPFDQAPQTLETDIPLSYMMVVGDVPMYYYDGRGNPVGGGAAQAPALTLPNPQTPASGVPASSPEDTAAAASGKNEAK